MIQIGPENCDVQPTSAAPAGALAPSSSTSQLFWFGLALFQGQLQCRPFVLGAKEQRTRF